ncbi:DUF2917 domain-containing protein [Rhodoferax sp.]|uniref:DUF2917 domain-containing protein n=1 Tax=Rhodoferax sp. TaxID=50421 RepID=UPI00284DCB95|nr:DUF2917 domain-containing protein [Rhodoferax sp.]MDR3367828.1 DUF2917 domain-containing protein [Rhodoferax sp.]
MRQIEHFELATPQPVSLKLGAGCMIRVTHGRLWLTRPDHRDDVWLHAGESWTLPASGKVWISAEPAAQFQLAQAFEPWRWSWLALLRSLWPARSRRASLPLHTAPAR